MQVSKCRICGHNEIRHAHGVDPVCFSCHGRLAESTIARLSRIRDAKAGQYEPMMEAARRTHRYLCEMGLNYEAELLYGNIESAEAAVAEAAVAEAGEGESNAKAR